MEPTLESISDYNQLSGEKKKVVWSVVIIGLLIGVGYTVASKVFTAKSESLSVKEAFVSTPFGTSEIPIK